MHFDDQADDRLLIARIARRDATALERLYALYRPRLWRYLWQQLDGDSGAVEDVLQEVFLAVWRAANDFRGKATVNTWIFRIAHRQLARRQRSIARRPEGHLANLTELTPPDDDGGRSGDHRGALAQASHEGAVLERLVLDAAFGRLAAKHREALELVYQQGFTLDEVAQVLDVPQRDRADHHSRRLHTVRHPHPCFGHRERAGWRHLVRRVHRQQDRTHRAMRRCEPRTQTSSPLLALLATPGAGASRRR
jgi:RNA polymerase sigma-70 factor, ECF subfamily